MQSEYNHSARGVIGQMADRASALMVMAGVLLLSACGGGGETVTQHTLTEPGKDGVPPTLTTVTIQPEGFVATGETVRIDIVASEAIMVPLITINGVRVQASGSVNAWTASRVMTDTDTMGVITFSIVFEDISGELGEAVTTTTNGSVADFCADMCPQEDLGPLEGKWKLSLNNGAGVGPGAGDISWWNTNAAGVTDARACWFDDTYEFDADGSFRNVQGGETWLEPWQGAAMEMCGAPVAPHDGSNNAIFEYDATAGTLKLTGTGAYLGLPKAVNGSELASPAATPGSVTYQVRSLVDNSLEVTIDVGGGAWWTYNLERISNMPVVGKWKLSETDGAGVGPAEGDISWWNTNAGGVVAARACWFDDIYHIGDDGSFQNYQGDETWLEPWQGVAMEMCGAPVAPHDGSAAGAWTYDSVAGTLTLDGTGSYLGLPKTVNGAELADPAATPDSVTYNINIIDDDNMRATIEVGGGAWWTYNLERSTDTDDLRGKWQLNTNNGAGVGPASGDISWWNTNAAGVVDARACWFDDVFNFGREGSFQNQQDGETWLEAWQGAAMDMCGAPVAPHDGSARAIYDYDSTANTLTLYGRGAHLGLAKAVNGQELADPMATPDSVTYDVLSFAGDNMQVTVEAGAGVWWTFELVRSSASPFAGNWKLDTNTGAGVGPASGDISWWNTDAGGVVTARACWFDDVYHFGGGGAFQNFQDGDTWLEPWQGPAMEMCGAPVAPHDGSSAGRFVFDSVAQTLTINGTGNYIGLPKAVNGLELADPAAAPASVTYDVLDVDDENMRLTIDVGAGAWWTYRLVKDE